MLRLLLSCVAIVATAASVGVLGLSALNVAVVGALLAFEGAAPGSTCATTRAFGARRPFCELHTGRPEVDAIGSRLLQEADALLLWPLAAAAAAAALALSLLALRALLARRRPPPRFAPAAAPS